MTLPDGARSLFELGAGFSPSEPISKVTLRMVVCSLHELQDRLHTKARDEARNRCEQHQVGTIPVPPLPQPFFGQQEHNNEVDVNFRMFANETLKVLNHYHAKRYSSNHTLVQKRGMRAVRELMRLKTIRLCVSGKGGEFVVIPHQLDVEITKKHLEDASLYRPSSEKEFKSKYRKLNNE
ncbi:unnamed protein product [Angiostrongylus costaricensis]|uniref:PAZ domain-containing protein n=1 Tax=Angiostrongylus costaricensis TaxID=334426 RepID=A0A0R3PY16_ANGCS|nr:unnamed protein product [Angiostrongylus costaricensis]